MEGWGDLPSVSQNISLRLQEVIAFPCWAEVQSVNQGAQRRENFTFTMQVAFEVCI